MCARSFFIRSLMLPGLLFLGAPASAVILLIELDGLDATASPVGGGQFRAVDVTGVLGPAGAVIFFDPPHLGLWTDSGIPGANEGSIDLEAGTFALNWGARATFDVFDESGVVQIGTGEILEVLPETGTFDPKTGLGTSSTDRPVLGDFILRNLEGEIVFEGDKEDSNENHFALVPDGAGGFDGLFLVGDGPELTIDLPKEMGGATLFADLTGTFHLIVVIPEPCPWDLDGNGSVGATDLLSLLVNWGPYEPCPPFKPADFDQNCSVGATDLLALLVNWGPCP